MLTEAPVSSNMVTLCPSSVMARRGCFCLLSCVDVCNMYVYSLLFVSLHALFVAISLSTAMACTCLRAFKRHFAAKWFLRWQ